jgi:uncharacterized protein
MNLLTGESKYFDVLERSLYNGALDGLSLSGDRFFYGNPLASNGRHYRREWFGTACCPANIARLVSSLGDYIYNKSNEGVWINLYVSSQTKVAINKTNVTLEQKSNYPWEGDVTVIVNPDKKTKFSVMLRLPGWATGTPVPGDLYKFNKNSAAQISISIKVNGKDFAYTNDKGYAVLTREWKKGDVISLTIPMEVKEIISKESVKTNEDRFALQRGPFIVWKVQTMKAKPGTLLCPKTQRTTHASMLRC